MHELRTIADQSGLAVVWLGLFLARFVGLLFHYFTFIVLDYNLLLICAYDRY